MSKNEPKVAKMLHLPYCKIMQEDVSYKFVLWFLKQISRISQPGVVSVFR